MWETIKKDPLVKTIVVLLIGVLAFGFAFNIMFGSGTSSMEDSSMMSSGYSLSATLEIIIEYLIKIVIIGLLLGAILWILRNITKQVGLGKGENFHWLKDDPTIKNALIITSFVLILIFGFSYLKGVFAGGSSEETVSTGGAYANSTMAYYFTWILALFLKLLIAVFVIGLGYGALMYLKDYANKTVISKETVTKEKETTKECPACNILVKENWNCCPNCGKDLTHEKENDTE